MNSDEKAFISFFVLSVVIGLIFGWFDSYLIWPIPVSVFFGFHNASEMVEGGEPNAFFMLLNVLIGIIGATIGWWIT